MLKAENLVKNFGGLRAVNHCSIEVEKGSIVGLIGPNGAGKTTLFNLITGLYKPDYGRVIFKGEDITGLRPDQIYRKGLTRTFQLTRELKGMSLLENMMLAFRNQKGENLFKGILNLRSVREQERENLAKALEILKTLGLYELRNEYAASLSGGQRKMLEIGRALATEPEMLLLDEPTAGATAGETGKLMNLINNMREEKGVTFLIVEHKMEVIMNLCDKIIVMNHGEKLAEGKAEEIRQDQRVREVYLGTGA